MNSNVYTGLNITKLSGFLFYLRESLLEYISFSDNDKETASVIKAITSTILYKAKEIGLKKNSILELNKILRQTKFIQGIKLSYLEQRLLDVLIFNRNSLLKVSKEGKIITEFNSSGVVVLNMRTIISESFPGLEMNSEANNLHLLSDAEQQALTLLRNNKFFSVKIIKQNGKLNRAESREQINVTERIVDIMKGANFQSIEIKQEDGKPVHINRVIKTKLN